MSISTVNPAVRTGYTPQGRQPSAPETGFDHLLRSLGQPMGAPSRGSDEVDQVGDVEFSKHATARLESRGIELSDADLADLSDAMDRLSEKNAKESLLMMGDTAFIVGVPKRTVITAMTRNEAIGSIFTNIDSTLFLR